MSDDLFAPEATATDEHGVKTAPVPPSDAVEDLFELGGDERATAAAAHAAAAGGSSAFESKSTGSPAPGSLEALLGAAFAPSPAAPRSFLLKSSTWIAFAIVVNSLFIGYLIYQFESRSSELSAYLKHNNGFGPPGTFRELENPGSARPDAAVPNHNDNAGPDRVAGGKPNAEAANPNKQNRAAAQPAAGQESTGPTPELLEAQALFDHGFYGEARKKYYQALLHLPPGRASREHELTARLGIARCFARELAPDAAPIRNRFTKEFTIGGDR
ncbi:MAG: hypothetical protein HY286_07090 [Planctomycetes bacterium]|nr:hypothetical protein [Planctomycetota bacterium]